MSWEDRVNRVGFFRGVPFFYSDVNGAVGRRTAVKEFPGRDEPEVEDLGRRPRRIPMEIFVIGADYDIARDNLVEAFETKGPGELEHPYWGTMTVVLEGEAQLKETTKEQRIARFSVTFLQTRGNLSFTEVADTATEVDLTVTKVETNLLDQFAKTFNVLDEVAEVAEDAVTTIEEATTALHKVRKRIASTMQVVNDAKAAIDDFVDITASLVTTPIDLANQFIALYATVFAGITEVTDAFTDLVDFFGSDDDEVSGAAGSILASDTRVILLGRVVEELSTFGDDFPTLPENTPRQEVTAENERQVIRLVKTSVAIEAARVVVDLNFENFDQAVEIRQLMTMLIDEISSDDNLPDELYTSLVDMRAALVEHLNQAASSLSELDDYTPKSTLPALVLAYQIYGDSRRESEILARNSDIRDPTAVQGGRVIRVLSDD
jgi:prophage DNA circulation protein